MEYEHIKDLIENAYGIPISNIEKVKNVYKIQSMNKQFCLKVIKYDFKHFWFIVSAIKHLQMNGFKSIPLIIDTKSHENYIQIDGFYAYLTEWVNSRQCNYDNPIDLSMAAIKLSELHDKSQNFNVDDSMKPRIGWFKWVEIFNTRKNEILDFRKRILEKNKKSQFDEIYMKIMDEQLKIAESSIINLGKSKYFDKMDVEFEKRGFCHHDYAHHNVLIDDDGNINIIDFDYCILDSNLHDLSSLIIRKMKNSRWSVEDAIYILDCYSKISKVYEDDIPIMTAFIEFPQDYWQVGIQYYWEKQPWEEDVFMKKINKICEDQEGKSEFLNKFRGVSYK